MPRCMRQMSESNTYHIVLKGNNAQQIFYDDEDCLSFLTVLKKACGVYNATLCAYCLMSNHVHLLMQFSENNMPQVFKSFGASFVFRYNAKYDRTGGLFNGRYYSKAVNDDAYLFMVLKYIHFNPVKAGLCEVPSAWQWSSYKGYAEHEECFADTAFIRELLTDNQFAALHQEKATDVFDSLMLDCSIWKMRDAQIKPIVEELLKTYSADELLILLKKAGIPAYRLAKLLQVSRDYAYKTSK